MNTVIVPASGIFEFNNLSPYTNVLDSSFSGIRFSFTSGELQITGKNPSNLNRFNINGTEGKLLNVTDSMSGLLFSVNDFVGLPLLEVYNDRVKIGGFNENTFVVSGGKVDVDTINFNGTNDRSIVRANGDMWYSTGDNVFRGRLNNTNVTIGQSKSFGTFQTIDHFRTTGAAGWATSGFRNGIPVLQFDAASRRRAQFMGIVPSGTILNSGITARIVWMAASATTADVVWALEFEKMNTDLDADNFDVVISSGTFTTNGTAGIPNISSITATSIDGITAGDPYRIRLTRLAEVGSDTMTGNAEFIMLELQATL